MKYIEPHKHVKFDVAEVQDMILQYEGKVDEEKASFAMGGLAVTSRTGSTSSGFRFSDRMLDDGYYNMEYVKKEKLYHWIDYNKPTELYIGQMKYIIDTLNEMDLHLTRARLSRVLPGEDIGEHSDAVRPEQYCFKLHVPFFTDDKVVMRCNNKAYTMQEGIPYMVNVNSIHSVHNRSNITRWHLVADCYDTHGNFNIGYCEDYDYHKNKAKEWRMIVDGYAPVYNLVI